MGQYNDFSEKKLGNIPIDSDRPTPAQNVHWGDSSAPEAEENSQKQKDRHGNMQAIQRRIKVKRG